MKPLSRTLRWWHLAILAVVLLLALLVCSAWALRAMGRGHYQEVVARVKAAGDPASVDDLVALAPVVDRQLQGRWDAWQQATVAAKRTLAGEVDPHSKAWDAWIAGAGPRPERIAAILADREADFAPLLPMLQHGGLVLSGFGWMAEDLPPGRRKIPFTTAMRLPNLLSVREAALWLRHSAVLAEDPREHLVGLDALVAAMARPVTLIDAMIAIAVADFRDRAYVELALRGRLPPEPRERWLAEPGRQVAMLGDAFAGESVLMAMGAAAMFDDAPAMEFLAGHNGSLIGLRMWLQGYEDCALMLAWETHAAQRLRGQRPDRWPDPHSLTDRMGPLGRIAMPNLDEAAITALQADAAQRQARLAVRLIGLARDGGPPADPAALAATLGVHELAPAGDHLHLAYERLGPDCFRLAVDPASPLSDFDDPRRMPMRTKGIGGPPPSLPLVWTRGGPLELRVPVASGR